MFCFISFFVKEQKELAGHNETHTRILRTGVEWLGGWWGTNHLYLSCSAFPLLLKCRPASKSVTTTVADRIGLGWYNLPPTPGAGSASGILYILVSPVLSNTQNSVLQIKAFFFNAVFMMHKIWIHMLKNMFRNSLFFSGKC